MVLSSLLDMVEVVGVVMVVTVMVEDVAGHGDKGSDGDNSDGDFGGCTVSLFSLSYPASLYGIKTTPSFVFDAGLALLIIARCINE